MADHNEDNARTTADSIAGPDVPTDLNEVSDSIQATLLTIWADFIDHIPFLFAGLLILFLTWALTAYIERLMRRFTRRWYRRQSMRDLITRLVTIGLWALGFLLAAGAASS
jgi:hypothetical protein